MRDFRKYAWCAFLTQNWILVEWDTSYWNVYGSSSMHTEHDHFRGAESESYNNGFFCPLCRLMIMSGSVFAQLCVKKYLVSCQHAHLMRFSGKIHICFPQPFTSEPCLHNVLLDLRCTKKIMLGCPCKSFLLMPSARRVSIPQLSWPSIMSAEEYHTQCTVGIHFSSPQPEGRYSESGPLLKIF